MSSRHSSDVRHLASSTSLPLNGDSEHLYSNFDGPPPHQTNPGGRKEFEPLDVRQRAMSDATKGKGAKKPMPAPKPLALSSGKVELLERAIRKKSVDIPVQLEENLYDEAFSVRKESFSKPKSPKDLQEGIYGVAIPVEGKRLPFVERNEVKGNVIPEPIYDEAVAVVANKIPAQQTSFRKTGLTTTVEENLYEEAATVTAPRLNDLYDDATIVVRSKLPSKEVSPVEPIYCDATPVMSIRLPKDEKYSNEKVTQGNGGTDNSDDEEPLYFNLLLLQKSIGNQKLWNSRADPHLGRVKVEQYARRISAFKVLPILPSKTSNLDGSSGPLPRQQSIEDEWSDGLIGLQPACDETEMKKMRKWIIADILKSEKSYCELLGRLVHIASILKDHVAKTHEIISLRDIETIFFGISELSAIHSDFVKSLQPVVEKSSKDSAIGSFLKEMIVREYHIAEEYLKNHHESITTFHRCCGESQQFADLTKAMPYRQGETSLEELLRKPIERFQCNALVLHDLKNCTPTSHQDFDLIQKTLKIAKNFLDICTGSNSASVEDSRYLVKNGIVVEKPDRDRKLRHIFLFNDILVCCKQKISNVRNQRLFYEVKWYIPLSDLKLEDKFSAQEEKQASVRHQEEINGHKKELVKLKKELTDEKQKMKVSSSQALSSRQNRSLESIRKKLAEQEAKLLVASPHLQLKILNRANQKTFVLLMASDYERTNWKSTISGLLGKGNQTPAKISLPDVINLINSQTVPKIIGSALDNNDILLEDERLNGSLNVVIHKLQGLREEADAFCCVELDSFGHFFMMARTNRAKGKEPVWNEDFDIDLEGALSMHILCYKIGQHTDSLLGKCSLVLHKESITDDFQNKVISLDSELLLTVSLKYSSPENLKRSTSSVKSDLFGVRFERVTKKEGNLVPLIVRACVEEIEKRGLNDVGIYRISGLSAEIQRLKKLFNKSTSEGAAGLANVDTNVLSGLLKLFFRELPEALFTDSAYQEFVRGIGLSDPDTKERFLLSQLVSLPACNYATILYLMNHLVKVAQYENSNKMSLMNLATVFGPTLLRPSEKDQKMTGTESLFCHGASEVAFQSTVLLYFLNLKAKNYNFPPPKAGK